jgi:hypothetical protein
MLISNSRSAHFHVSWLSDFIFYQKPLYKSLHQLFFYSFITILPPESGVTELFQLHKISFLLLLSNTDRHLSYVVRNNFNSVLNLILLSWFRIKASRLFYWEIADSKKEDLVNKNFRPFGCIAPKTFDYLAFQSFDVERTWWRLFQKRVVRTKFDIYLFIFIMLYVAILIRFWTWSYFLDFG